MTSSRPIPTQVVMRMLILIDQKQQSAEALPLPIEYLFLCCGVKLHCSSRIGPEQYPWHKYNIMVDLVRPSVQRMAGYGVFMREYNQPIMGISLLEPHIPIKGFFTEQFFSLFKPIALALGPEREQPTSIPSAGHFPVQRRYV